MILAAIDDRIKLSFPVVMVSTAMQGGCTCENASLLRVNTGNVEFAALFAPKPQGMNTANDWTKEMATKGFPELQKLYAAVRQEGQRLPPARRALPAQLQRRHALRLLHLPQQALQARPAVARDRDRTSSRCRPSSSPSGTTQHPAPKAADPEFERKLLKWFTDDADKQLRAAAATPEGLQQAHPAGGGGAHRPHASQCRRRASGNSRTSRIAATTSK